MSYKSVKPLSQQAKYNPNELVDFAFHHPGVDYTINSFYISGRLVVAPDGVTPLTSATNIYIDGRAGIHGAFHQITVSSNDAVLENTQYVARYVAMNSDANNTDNQICSKLSSALSLQFPVSDDNSLIADANTGKSFYCPLVCCLNKCNRQFDGDELPNLKVSITLSSASRFLWGSGVVAASSYYLTELELHYMIEPKTKKSGPLQMMTIDCYRQTVDSSSNNIQIINNKPTSRVVGSFVLASKESTAIENYLSRDGVNISRLEWTVNDVESGANYLNYPLENPQEIAHNYLESLNNTPDVHKVLTASRANRGIGLPLSAAVKNSVIGIQMDFDSVQSLVGYFYQVGYITL